MFHFFWHRQKHTLGDSGESLGNPWWVYVSFCPRRAPERRDFIQTWLNEARLGTPLQQWPSKMPSKMGKHRRKWRKKAVIFQPCFRKSEGKELLRMVEQWWFFMGKDGMLLVKPPKKKHLPSIQTSFRALDGLNPNKCKFPTKPCFLRGVEDEGKDSYQNDRGFRRFQASKSAVVRMLTEGNAGKGLDSVSEADGSRVYPYLGGPRIVTGS